MIKNKLFHRTINAMKLATYNGTYKRTISLVRIEKETGGFCLVAIDSELILYKHFEEIYWHQFQDAVREAVGVDIGETITSGYLALDENVRIKTGLSAFSYEDQFNRAFNCAHSFPNWRNVFSEDFTCEGPPPIFSLKMLNKIRLILLAYIPESKNVAFNPIYSKDDGLSVTEIEGLIIAAMPLKRPCLDHETLNRKIKEMISR